MGGALMNLRIRHSQEVRQGRQDIRRYEDKERDLGSIKVKVPHSFVDILKINLNSCQIKRNL